MSGGTHLALISVGAVAPRRLAEFDARSNAITPVRLGLALTVVASHSIAIGRFGTEPSTADGLSVGYVAVLAFFTLSGFLIARSRETTGRWAFARNRALRIFPAYWLALAGTAVVILPLASWATGQAAPSPAEYILPRLAFLGDSNEAAAALGGRYINPSLWTLGVETACYLTLCLLPARFAAPTAFAVVVLVSGMFIAMGGGRADYLLIVSFAFGVLAWAWRVWIPVWWPAVAIAAAAAGVGWATGAPLVLAAGVAYLALCSAWLPLRLSRDLSYGVYVLAAPVQALLAAAGIATGHAVLFVAASFAAVLPLAWLSWSLVEERALRLRARARP